MWRTRLCALVVTFVAGVIPLHAGFVKFWQLNETEGPNSSDFFYEGMPACDFGLGVLERATGEHFRSVAAARAWLDARHIPR